MVERQLKRERFVLDDECTFEYLYERRGADNIGELIDIALERIEEDNRAKLEGVFRNISFNSDNLGKTKDRNRRLKNLLEDFSDERLDLRPSVIKEDVIGNAYRSHRSNGSCAEFANGTSSFSAPPGSRSPGSLP